MLNDAAAPLHTDWLNGIVLITASALMVMIAGEEVPPPGAEFVTVMVSYPALIMSEVLIDAWSEVELMYVVERFDPFNFTCDVKLKFDPLIVSVKPDEPVCLQGFEIELMDGKGLFTAKEPLDPFSLPDVFTTVIVKFPPSPIVTECESNCPDVNAELVPLPETRFPVDETVTVPLNAFGPLLHILLFASRAVN